MENITVVLSSRDAAVAALKLLYAALWAALAGKEVIYEVSGEEY